MATSILPVVVLLVTHHALVSSEGKWAEMTSNELFIHLTVGMQNITDQDNRPVVTEKCMLECLKQGQSCRGFSVQREECTIVQCPELIEDGAILKINALKLPLLYQDAILLPNGLDLERIGEGVRAECGTQTTPASTSPHLESTSTVSPVTTTNSSSSPSTTPVPTTEAPVAQAPGVLKKPDALKSIYRSQYPNEQQFFRVKGESEWTTPVLDSNRIGKLIPVAEMNQLGAICSNKNCLAALTRRHETQNIWQLLTAQVDINQEALEGMNKVLGYVGTQPGCCGASIGIREHSRNINNLYQNFDYNQSSVDNTSPLWNTADTIFYIWE